VGEKTWLTTLPIEGASCRTCQRESRKGRVRSPEDFVRSLPKKIHKKKNPTRVEKLRPQDVGQRKTTGGGGGPVIVAILGINGNQVTFRGKVCKGVVAKRAIHRQRRAEGKKGGVTILPKNAFVDKRVGLAWTGKTMASSITGRGSYGLGEPGRQKKRNNESFFPTGNGVPLRRYLGGKN